jgi:hypothetical protein
MQEGNEKGDLYRDIEEDELEEDRDAEVNEITEIVSEELNEDEEDEYLFEDMNRTVQDVNRVMGLINSRFEFLYAELQRRGINRNLTRYIFRTIVSFADTNYTKYTGTPEQKTTALLNDLRRQFPWIFFTMRAYGVPVIRVNQILRTISAFALSNLRAAAPPPGDIEERATRITNLLRQQTSIFTDLRNAGVPANQITPVVRTVVLFTLRNINLNQPPANLQTKATELVGLIERVSPALIKQLQGYGLTMTQIRQVMRRIIFFTLQRTYKREDEE